MYRRGSSKSIRFRQVADCPQVVRFVGRSAVEIGCARVILACVVSGTLLISACATPSHRGIGPSDADQTADTIATTRVTADEDTVPWLDASSASRADPVVTQDDNQSRNEPRALRLLPQIPPETNQRSSSVVLASATEPLTPLRPIELSPVASEELATVTSEELSPGTSDEAGAHSTSEWEMSLEEVLQHALDNHPLLRVRQHEVEIARGRLVTAGLLVNPRLVMDTESPVHESGPTDLTTRVEFTFITAHKRRHRESAAQAAIRRVQMALARESELVLLEVAAAATQVLYLQERLALHTRLQDLTAERASRALARAVDGDTQLDLVNKVEADIDAVEAHTQRLDTSANLAMARTRLTRAMGLDPEIAVRMRGSLGIDLAPLLPLPTVLAMARNNNPRLAGAYAALDESQRRHIVAHAEAVPDFTLGPRYQDALGVAEDTIGVRFNMDLPVFDRNPGGILETAAQVQSNQAMVRVAELNSTHDVLTAYAEIQSIQESLTYYEEEVLELIKRNEQFVDDPSIQGVISPDQILEIRIDLFSLQLQYLQLRARYHQLVTQLEILLGEQITFASVPLDGSAGDYTETG